MTRRAAAAITATVALTLGLVVIAAHPVGASLMDGAERWTRTEADAQFHWASPVIGDVNGDGNNDVVTGGLDGKVYAYDANGAPLPGWPASAGAAVASSPAIGDLEGDGSAEVVVGVGSLGIPNQQGGVAIINSNGTRRCFFATSKVYGESAVFNAPAIGDIDGDGSKDIAFGSFDHRILAINKDCGLIAAFDNTDTVWSSPALYDINGDGKQEIYIGGDATANPKGLPHSGGYYRSLEYNGTTTFAQRWVNADSSETFQSATAIADMGDGRLAAVTGTGADYCRNQGGRCGDSNKVWAFHLDDGSQVAGWPKSVSAGYATFLAAPAIGDIDGDGKVDVVVGSTRYSGGNPQDGQLDALLGNGGRWTFGSQGDGEMVASPVIADVNGGGTNEVLIGVAGQLFVLNGPDGRILRSGLAAGAHGLAHKNAAAVGEIGKGRWGVASAGFDPTDGNKGYMTVYDIPAPASAPWPQYKKNARRTGGDPAPGPAPITCPPGIGYWLVAADGGIFAFNQPFLGSTGDIRLNQPIVGMTATASRAGYQFVARDGGIFSYGDAGFFGSTGSGSGSSPIVAMATTPSGRGYWLVAADGSVFNFGDAGHLGSPSGLNQPIVAMAATPSGRGYWLVARDGGVFNYGDASFFGSTGNIHLNQPIVGMARSNSGNGYWFVATDGGIFNYGDASFFGSTGNIHLNKPVVGMKASGTGGGYWFVATDGGIFAFGDAQFCGSTGNIRLNQPIVGMG